MVEGEIAENRDRPLKEILARASAERTEQKGPHEPRKTEVATSRHQWQITEIDLLTQPGKTILRIHRHKKKQKQNETKIQNPSQA